MTQRRRGIVWVLGQASHNNREGMMDTLYKAAAQLGITFDGAALRGSHTRCLLALALADMADHLYEISRGCGASSTSIRLVFGDQ
jgi:hypothetical protein